MTVGLWFSLCRDRCSALVKALSHPSWSHLNTPVGRFFLFLPPLEPPALVSESLLDSSAASVSVVDCMDTSFVISTEPVLIGVPSVALALVSVAEASISCFTSAIFILRVLPWPSLRFLVSNQLLVSLWRFRVVLVFANGLLFFSGFFNRASDSCSGRRRTALLPSPPNFSWV